MAKINLTSTEWRELIFQGKNKEYGAYKMRSESESRHSIAILIVVLMTVVGLNIPKLVDLVKPKLNVVSDGYGLMDISQIERTEETVVKPIEPIAPPPAQFIKTIQFLAPVIEEDDKVNTEEGMKDMATVNKSDAVISIIDEIGSPNGTVDKSSLKEGVTGTLGDDDVIQTTIEQMPLFPGGEQELLNYIGRNVRYPIIDQENNVQGKVILRFVVTKTGTVDRVEVIRSLSSSSDNEAVRVVKSLPRFIPGKQNGKSVSVWFTLPVTFKLE
jgi:periplasmic protein TonB